MAIDGYKSALSPEANAYLRRLETTLKNAANTINALQTRIEYLEKKLSDTAGSSLGDGTVTTSKLADNSVTTIKIANSAVTNAKIASVAGSKVTGTVANASVADNADGVTSSAYNRNAVGSGFFGVWMNAQLQLMRNTSSRKYKENIARLKVDPQKVLALEPVEYDRINGGHEYGLIAEDVNELVPEIVVWFSEQILDENGNPTGEFGEAKIDGIRYDLLSVALLEVVKDLNDRITELENNG